MYRTGHYGTALLVAAPAGLVLARLGAPALGVVAAGVALWLAMLPDVDQRLPGVSHRGVTHTFLFALLVGGAFAGVGLLAAGYVAAAVPLAAYGFAVGLLAVLAHLAADWLTPMGVPLLWPLSGRRFSLGLWTADSRVGNGLLFALGVFAAAAATLSALGVV